MSKNLTISTIETVIEMLNNVKKEEQEGNDKISKMQQSVIDELEAKHSLELQSFKSKIEELIGSEVCKDKEIAKLKKQDIEKSDALDILALENKQMKRKLLAIDLVDVKANEYITDARKKAKKSKEK